MIRIYLYLINLYCVCKSLMACHRLLHPAHPLLQFFIIWVLCCFGLELEFVVVFHNSLPVYFIVDGEIELDQALVHVKGGIVGTFFVVHQEVGVKLLKIILMAISSPRVPLRVPLSIEDHLGAKLPPHFYLITTTDKFLMK